jgi:predicted metal-dependent enzyme (double-stranded beta helix superfamily)
VSRADDPPVKAFLARVDELASGDAPDVPAIGRAMADLATDEKYFAPLVASMVPDDMGVIGLHVPERGPRLFLFHRPHGVMSYVHSHGTWAIIAPVAGVETHRRYDVAAARNGRAEIALAEELRLRPGDAATLVPPDDIHSHGHAGGEDELAYTLIMTGDDQLQFPRREYDLAEGTYRDLPPGEFGQLNMPDRA